MVEAVVPSAPGRSAVEDKNRLRQFVGRIEEKQLVQIGIRRQQPAERWLSGQDNASPWARSGRAKRRKWIVSPKPCSATEQQAATGQRFPLPRGKRGCGFTFGKTQPGFEGGPAMLEIPLEEQTDGQPNSRRGKAGLTQGDGDNALLQWATASTSLPWVTSTLARLLCASA